MWLFREHLVALPHPRGSNGFIDEKKVFQLLVGTLKLPLEYMNELTFQEFSWLIESHHEKEIEHWELMAYAVQVGYARNHSKKKIEMFEGKQNKQKTNQITKEQKEKELSMLDNTFGRR